MNPSEKLNLQKMINENDVEDCTNDIREKKHSQLIKDDVKALLQLKNKYPRLMESNINQFNNMCVSKCNFLYTNYTDLFNRIKNDELDLNILDQFLIILKKIEDKKLDQHEGSFIVGKILKQMYVDSALKKSEKLDKKKKNDTSSIDPHKPKNISYKQYKLYNMN